MSRAESGLVFKVGGSASAARARADAGDASLLLRMSRRMRLKDATSTGRVEKVLGFGSFVVVVVCFFFGRLLGWRAVGAALVVFGLWAAWKRRIPYGLEGRPPFGYLEAFLAIIVGIAAITLGIVTIFAPEALDSVSSRW